MLKNTTKITSGWPSFWHHGKNPPLWAKAISFVYCGLVKLKNKCYQKGICKTQNTKVPLIVIGNRVVGGTGKTPVMIGLVTLLKPMGLRIGIVSRGYGRKTNHLIEVTQSSHAIDVGDEPLMLFQQLHIPVVVATQRMDAVHYLEQHYPDLDLVLSDDGWQHLSMGRDAVIEIVDGEKGYGNGYCLPAGPLREITNDASKANLTLYNEKDFYLKPICWQNLLTRENKPLENLTGSVIAMAGIGNPQRFFTTLSQLGLALEKEIPLTDHQTIRDEDFDWDDGAYPLVMTMKDAVRCHHFARPHWWALEVNTLFTPPIEEALKDLVNATIINHSNTLSGLDCNGQVFSERI